MTDWRRIDALIDGSLDACVSAHESEELAAALEEDPAVQQRYAQRLLLHALLHRHAACCCAQPVRRVWPRVLAAGAVAAVLLVSLSPMVRQDARPTPRTITLTVSQADGSQTRVRLQGLRQFQTYSMKIPIKEKQS